jgi:hypothetical protein
MASADRHFFGDLQIVHLLTDESMSARQTRRGPSPSKVV